MSHPHTPEQDIAGLGHLPLEAYPLLTAQEVATWLGVSSAWVRQHSNGSRRPLIPSVKLGKCLRYRTQRIQEFIDSLEKSGGK